MLEGMMLLLTCMPNVTIWRKLACFFYEIHSQNLVSWYWICRLNVINYEKYIKCSRGFWFRMYVVSWNASQHRSGHEAWNLFEQRKKDSEHGYDKETLMCYEKMWVEGVPLDDITLACVLKACVSNGDTTDVSWIYVEIILTGLEKELLASSTLVSDVYVKYSLLTETQHVSLKLRSKDVVLWNALISGFTKCEDVETIVCCIENM